MSTTTITTTGCTNPSSTSRAYWGYCYVKPPTSGGALDAQTELTTANYTAIGADDATILLFQLTHDYIGIEIQLLVPADIRSATFTQLDYGAKCGCVGDGGNGATLYIRNNATPAWEKIGDNTAGSAVSLLSGSKTTNIANYIDSNSRIRLLAIGRYSHDINNDVYMYNGYTYATLTYEAGSASYSTTFSTLAVSATPALEATGQHGLKSSASASVSATPTLAASSKRTVQSSFSSSVSATFSLAASAIKNLWEASFETLELDFSSLVMTVNMKLTEAAKVMTCACDAAIDFFIGLYSAGTRMRQVSSSFAATVAGAWSLSASAKRTVQSTTYAEVSGTPTLTMVANRSYDAVVAASKTLIMALSASCTKGRNAVFAAAVSATPTLAAACQRTGKAFAALMTVSFNLSLAATCKKWLHCVFSAKAFNAVSLSATAVAAKEPEEEDEDMVIVSGNTSTLMEFDLFDMAGALVTGKTSDDVTIVYCRQGQSGDAVSVPLQAGVAGLWIGDDDDGYGFVEVAGMPGRYQFSFPDAAFAAGAFGVTFRITCTGVRTKTIPFQIWKVNPWDEATFGIEALPSELPGAPYGLTVLDAAGDAPVATITQTQIDQIALQASTFLIDATGGGVTMAEAIGRIYAERVGKGVLSSQDPYTFDYYAEDGETLLFQLVMANTGLTKERIDA